MEQDPLFDFLKQHIENDSELAEAFLNEKKIDIKTYKIDFKKVKTLKELLGILQHLNFVISGPQEYFDEYCKGIQDYLVEVEEGS